MGGDYQVLVGMQWRDLGVEKPFPRYKEDGAVCRRIVGALGYPADAGTNDDTLDAYTGYWLTGESVYGRAALLGDRMTGGYVVPIGPSFESLSATFCLA